jgi:NAD(P)H-dependent FMN reductase
LASSKDSINKQLATYAAGQFKNASEVLDLNDYEIPISQQTKKQQVVFQH